MASLRATALLPLAGPVAGQLVDVAVHQLELSLLVQVLADHPLGQLHGQLTHLPPELLERPLALRADLVLGPGHDLPRLVLRLGQEVLAHLVGGLPGLVDDLPGLGAGLPELLLVPPEGGLGVVPGLLGTLQVAADLLGPGPHGLVEAGERVPGQHPEHDDERQAPEDQLARLRQDGVVLFLLGLGGLPLGDHRAEHCVVHRSPYRMKARTNPISARASVKAIPRNIVVRTMPAASGWRAMASMARPTTSPMPIPGPMAARP